MLRVILGSISAGLPGSAPFGDVQASKGVIMKRYGWIALIVSGVLLVGCSSPTEGGSVDGTARAADGPGINADEPDVPLRNYTSKQITRVLKQSRDAAGTEPVQVLTEGQIRKQAEQMAAAAEEAEKQMAEMAEEVEELGPLSLQPTFSPEACGQYAMPKPEVEEGVTMGFAVFASENNQTSLGVSVDGDGGHQERFAKGLDALEACQSFTMTIMDQEAEFSVTEVPISLDAKSGIGTSVSGQVEDIEMKLVGVSGYSGSVMINAVSMLSPGGDEDVAVERLVEITEETLDDFENLPS